MPLSRASDRRSRAPELASTEPTFPARLLHAAARALRSRGEDPAPWLAEFGLSAHTLVTAERIPHSVGERLYIAAALRLAEPAFGLEIGAHTDPVDHGELAALVLLLSSSPDPLAAFQRFVSLLHDRAELSWKPLDGRIQVIYRLRGMIMTRETQDAVLAAIIQRIRAALPVAWSPSEVWFSYPTPADITPYERFFAAPVKFGMEETALWFRAWRPAKPSSGPQLAETVAGYVGTMLDRSKDTLDAVQQVREAIRSGRIEGNWSLERVAQVLRTSARTLTRRLTSEGTTFSAVLDTLRYELAREQLGSGAGLAEIADALGFSDVRSFSRAFKRWSGSTPSDARR